VRITGAKPDKFFAELCGFFFPVSFPPAILAVTIHSTSGHPTKRRSRGPAAEFLPMPDPPIDTVYMHRCVERWQAGDRAAADELVQMVATRLELLTRKMLR
jgi:hypothetical protein